ncbi:MAG: ATP-dependent Clp protease adapter ClpS [Candidatus Berkiellales bacterium]
MGTQFERGAVTSVVKVEKKTPKIGRPSLYEVYLLNDDYTPMDFVVVVLEKFFAMSTPHALTVMLKVHREGKATCGVYTRDIAETRVVQVNEFARLNEHPLLCKMKKM